MVKKSPKKTKKSPKKNKSKKTKTRSYLNKRGYNVIKSQFSFKELHKCKKDLTVVPYVNSDFGVQPTPFPVYLESVKKLYLPRYYGISEFGEPDKDRLTEGLEIDLKFNGEMRDKQAPIIKAFMDTCRPKGHLSSQSFGGIISVPCGHGKTIMALNLISKLKRKTLIIVHKEFLIEQWMERISEFLPDARVGRIQQKKIDVQNKDIVIGMLQSISMKDYEMEIFDDFGFCIVDECHHIAAQVFSRALPKIGCRYMCGLSATPKRADGLSKVFEWYLGPIVYQLKRKGDDDNMLVKTIEFNSTVKPYSKEELTFQGKICMAKMINNVCGYEKRTRFIIEIIKSLLPEDRHILILSDRRAHLTQLFELLQEANIESVGFYVGGMKQKDRKESENKSVVLGTYNMASEGMDIPILDTVILASPRSDIRQSIGRILRKKHKHQSVVVDIVDYFSCFIRQGIKRRRVYKSCKYDMEIIKVYDGDHTTVEELFEHTKVNVKKYCNSKIKTKTKKNCKTIWCNGQIQKIPKKCLI